MRKLVSDASCQRLQVSTYRLYVESSIAREVWNSESSADIDSVHRPWRVDSEPQGELDGFALAFADCLCAQVLRSAENVEAFEGKRTFPNLPEQVRHRFRVDAELLRPAAHLH